MELDVERKRGERDLASLEFRRPVGPSGRGTDRAVGGDRFLDGSRHSYTRYVWEWCVPWVDFTVAYDGTGSGSASVCEVVTIEIEGETYEDVVYVPCAVTIANGTCTQTCQNGAVSSCTHLL